MARHRVERGRTGMGRPADLTTFTVGLSPMGAETATHSMCATAFTVEQRAGVESLQAVFRGAVVVDYDLDAGPGRPAAERARLGLQR